MSNPSLDTDTRKPLLLWPLDSDMLLDAASQLSHYGYRAEWFSSPKSMVTAEAHNPTALVDCSAISSMADKSALNTLAGRMPLACLSTTGSIASRLNAVRLGCQAYFARPLDMSILLDTLDRLTAPPRAEAGRVLVVEDSPALSAFYAAHLAEAGFMVQVINDPLNTLDALNEQPPELILLDMNMPGASGEEIAEVIRQQEAFLSIPIVFLSAESSASRQRQAMNLGGDEFLQKPIQPEHLIAAVRARVIRYRALRALMVRDSLTGLLNHTTFKERLRTEVARARRLDKPLSVALLDIDHFKRVNDTYGHPAGDRVIKNLSRLLRQRLRGTDVIGRYGGEEFAVALVDTPIDAALEVLQHIRESFAAILQHASSQTFHTTLSAGAAQYSSLCSDGEALIQAADEALYAAKHGGRNRVVTAYP